MTTADPSPAASSGAGRAGRNLPVAIAIGLSLGALVLGTLYTYRPAFIGVVVLFVGIGTWELVRALHGSGVRPPLVPVVVGGSAAIVLSYVRGSEATAVAAVLTVVAVVAWRLAEGGERLLADAAAGIFALVYVPFLASFAALLLEPSDGARRVTVFIATVVCSDVGGYAAGVLAGRHPMAPSISPKKSWEGVAGSAGLCAAAGAAFLPGLLNGHAWQGVLFGLAVMAAGVLGDLGESMIKRDLGIKDMGTLLPGHGGVMDRLDSLLLAAPVAWLLLTAFVPT